MMMKKKEILQSLLKLVVIVFAATVLGKVFPIFLGFLNDLFEGAGVIC